MSIIKNIKKVLKKESLNTIDKISKKTGTSKMKIFLDVFKMLNSFNIDYYEYNYYEFYLLNDEERKSFITNNINNQIINKYNDKELSLKLENKKAFNEIFKKYTKRDYIDLKEKSFKEFKEFISDKDEILASSIDYQTFEKIKIVKDLLKNEYNVLKIYNSIMKKEEYIVEEVLIENKELTKLYNEGINYLRLNTFINDKEVYILNRVLKINKSNDEKLYAIVSSDGIITYPAINQKGTTYITHPDTKIQIIEFKLPFFKEAEELVKKAAREIKEVKYVGWDVLITDDGVSLLKATSKPLAFELKPSISGKKEGLKKEYEKYIGEKL